LKLISSDATENHISLIGKNKEFKFRIIPEPDSRPIDNIDLQDIILYISNKSDNTSFVTKNINDTKSNSIDKLIGSDFTNISDEHTLYIHLNKEDIANF